MSAVEKEQPEAAKTRFAKDQLKAFVERIERLEEEKKTISDDIRDVYAESKGNGFDVKALRAVVRLRKQDANERNEQQLILETYMNALGCWRRRLSGSAAIRGDVTRAFDPLQTVADGPAMPLPSPWASGVRSGGLSGSARVSPPRRIWRRGRRD